MKNFGVNRLMMMLAVLLAGVQTMKADSWNDAANRAEEFSAINEDDKELHITSEEELALLSYRSSINYNGEGHWTGWKIYLDADLDMSDHDWVPIGRYDGPGATSTVPVQFAGQFFGQEHTISGLKVVSDMDYYISFIAEIRHDGNTSDPIGIYDLIIKNSTFKSTQGNYVAPIVGGVTKATIRNCHVGSDVTVEGAQFVGGIVGYGREPEISGCSSAAVINGLGGVGNSASEVGGIVGQLNSGGTLRDNIFVGSITANKDDDMGAIIGRVYNAGTVTCDNNLCTDATLAAKDDKVTLAMVFSLGEVDYGGDPITVYSDDYDYKVFPNGILDHTSFYAPFNLALLSGSGTETDPYIIANNMSWKILVAYVNNGGSTDDMYFKQTGKVEITEPLGTEANPFNGFYNGNGKVLDSRIHQPTVGGIGPFGAIRRAHIENLIVWGFVDGGVCCGGLVGTVLTGEYGEYAWIENCWVSTVVTGFSNSTDAAHVGGIVGHAKEASLTVKGCLFDGKLSKDGGDMTNTCGGAIVGWCNDATSIDVVDCAEKCIFIDIEYQGFCLDINRSATTIKQRYCYTANGLPGNATTVYSVAKNPYFDEFTIDYEDNSTMEYNVPKLKFYSDDFGHHQLLFINGIYYGRTGDAVTFSASYDSGGRTYLKGVTANNVPIETRTGDTYTVVVGTENIELLPIYGSVGVFALWDASTKTLTFTNGNVPDAGEGQQLWEGETVTNSSTTIRPDWMASAAGVCDNVTKVVFDESFAQVRPKSLFDWFFYCENLETVEGLENLNTSETTTMAGLFCNCTKLTSLDLSGFDTQNVTNMNYMFSGCSNLQTITVGSGWTVAGVTESDDMFKDCTSLVGGNGTIYDAAHTDKEYARADGGSGQPGYLYDPNAPVVPTAIDNANFNDNINFNDDAIYDLMGRKIEDGKLSNCKLTKGIYIVNGKKTVVK